MEPKKYNKLSVISFVIVCLILSEWIPIFGEIYIFLLNNNDTLVSKINYLLIVFAFIFGIISLKQINKTGEKGAGLAQFAIFISSIQIAIFIIFSIMFRISGL